MPATGIRSINEEYKKSQKEIKSYVRKLTLGDGEKAFGNFLATGEESDHRYQSYNVHSVNNNGRFDKEFCTYDDTGNCARCLDSKPTQQFGVWVWVNYILRKKQNPALGKYDNAKTWRKVKYRDELYYYQEINDVRLWTSGPGNKRYIFNQLFEHFEQFGSLMDRGYIWSRTGSSKEDTNYLIKPMADTITLNEKQMEIYRQLPSVIDVVAGRQSWPPVSTSEIITDDGEDVEVLEAPAVVSNMAESDEFIPLEDDGDDEAEEITESVIKEEFVTDDIDLINSTVDDVLASSEDDEEESEKPVRLRPRNAAKK